MMELFSTPEAWISLFTLAALEIVLGIDNIVFISIIASKLPEHQRPLATRIGLALAMISRLALLASLSWVMRLSTPLFEVFSHPVTGRDLILIFGGLFLIAKATFWMKAAPTHYPTEESIRECLENAGLEGSCRPLWGKTPFSNYLLTFRKSG